MPAPLSPRPIALLAINLLFLMVWGFAGFDKALHGPPDWFLKKFGDTLLGRFPGATASFWWLAVNELAAFALAVGALARAEFLERRRPVLLPWTGAASLLVFVQLSFGLWLTADFTGGAQMFSYFAGTLICLHFILAAPASRVS